MKNRNFLQRLFQKEEPKPRFKFKGWHAALFVVGINGLKNLIEPNSSVARYRKKLRTPSWNPSNNVYALAWGINNISRAAGNIRLLNKPDYPNRNALLRLQALMWINYLTFNKVFAGQRSPLMGLIWAESYKLMSIASLYLARAGGDTKITLSLVPNTLWSVFNSATAWNVGLNNKDKVFKTLPKQAGTRIVSMYPGKRKAA
jgi:tryptophan-rich sensory protein